MINHFLFSALVTSISVFLIGVFILTRDIKNKLYRIFFMYSLTISIWSFCVYKHTLDISADKAIVLGKILMFAAILNPLLLVRFVIEFLKLKSVKNLLIVSYAFCFLLYVLNFFNLLVNGVGYTSNHSYTVAGALYGLFILYLVFLLASSFYFLFKKYNCSIGTEKRKIAYLIFVSLIGYLGALHNVCISYGIKLYPLYPGGNYLIFLYVLIIAYAIFRHQFLDIKVVIKRTLIFTLLFAIVYGVVSLLVFGINLLLLK